MRAARLPLVLLIGLGSIACGSTIPLSANIRLVAAMTELDGTSGTATYGPPYNNAPGTGQDIVGA